MNQKTNRTEPILVDNGLELLTEEQCRELLGEATIGRLGVTVGGLPVILPVNFALLNGDIVFRSGAGTKLRAAADRAVVAFEVDAFDDHGETGWSVLAIGRAIAITDPDELELLRTCGPTPWARGSREHCVRVTPEMLTGRKIVLHDAANEVALRSR